MGVFCGILRFLVTAAAVPLCAQLMDGVRAVDMSNAIVLGLLLAVVYTVLRPLLRLLLKVVNFCTLGQTGRPAGRSGAGRGNGGLRRVAGRGRHGAFQGRQNLSGVCRHWIRRRQSQRLRPFPAFSPGFGDCCRPAPRF